MIGRQDTGTLSTNHMRAFCPSFSKAETGFKNQEFEPHWMTRRAFSARL